MSASPFIRTVLGDIAPEHFGPCDAHEHVVLEDGFMTRKWPDFLLNDSAKIIEELRRAYASGLRSIVDSQPVGARNVEKLVDVSRATGMHILCPTGVHLEKYYPPDHWMRTMDEAALADFFVEEVELGIYLNDSPGGVADRTPYRAGLIKVAGGLDRLSEQERRAFRAAGAAQRRCGAPILTHTEQGTAGEEQIDLLVEGGANPAHIILSHCDRKPEIAYHRRLLERGVCLEYDSGFRWKTGQGNPTLDLLCTLALEYPHQLVVGMDAARFAYWKSYGGQPGLDWLLGTFRPMMENAGIPPDILEAIFVSTPARAYRFISHNAPLLTLT